MESGQPICLFFKIEPKRKETKKIVKVSCFNFAGIQQSILLILSSLDPHFQALTDSVISLGYSPLNPLPFPYCTVWSNMSFFVPMGFLLKLPPNKISVQLGLWTLIFRKKSDFILVFVQLSRHKQIGKLKIVTLSNYQIMYQSQDSLAGNRHVIGLKTCNF